MIPRLPHSWGYDEYPYEVLAGSGIAPHSSHDEVLEASFQLQGADWSAELRRALDEVRRPEARLVVDFFLYQPLLSAPQDLVLQQLRRVLAEFQRTHIS